jgi:hypothetical protein
MFRCFLLFLRTGRDDTRIQTGILSQPKDTSLSHVFMRKRTKHERHAQMRMLVGRRMHAIAASTRQSRSLPSPQCCDFAFGGKITHLFRSIGNSVGSSTRLVVSSMLNCSGASSSSSESSTAFRSSDVTASSTSTNESSNSSTAVSCSDTDDCSTASDGRVLMKLSSSDTTDSSTASDGRVLMKLWEGSDVSMS